MKKGTTVKTWSMSRKQSHALPMAKKMILILLTSIFVMPFSSPTVRAQVSRSANYGLYSKDLLKAVKTSQKLQRNSHSDKKEVGVVDAFIAASKKNPEEDGLCYLYLADYYMHRCNVKNFDTAFYCYSRACNNIPEQFDFERNNAYNNLGACYLYMDSIEKAYSYMRLAAERDSVYYNGLASLCLYGGPDYFDPVCAVDYASISMECGLQNDMFPFIYCAKYIVDAISDGTFDKEAFEMFRVGAMKMNSDSDPTAGGAYIRAAAQRNFFPAVYEYGNFLLTGKIPSSKTMEERCDTVKKMIEPLLAASYPPAFHLQAMACQYNHLMMGGMLVSAEGYQEAYPYIEKACKLGYPPLIAEKGRYYQFNLGRICGVDYEMAAKYYNTAASEGYYIANIYLKNMEASKQLRSSVKELISLTSSLTQDIKAFKNKAREDQFVQKCEQQGVVSSAAPQKSKTDNGKTSDSETSVNDKKKIPSTANMIQWRQLNHVYDDYVNMLIRMDTGWDYYSDSRRKDIQSTMRKIRTDWESRGYDSSIRIHESKWETWDGTCTKYKKY